MGVVIEGQEGLLRHHGSRSAVDTRPGIHTQTHHMKVRSEEGRWAGICSRGVEEAGGTYVSSGSVFLLDLLAAVLFLVTSARKIMRLSSSESMVGCSLAIHAPNWRLHRGEREGGMRLATAGLTALACLERSQNVCE